MTHSKPWILLTWGSRRVNQHNNRYWKQFPTGRRKRGLRPNIVSHQMGYLLPGALLSTRSIERGSTWTRVKCIHSGPPLVPHSRTVVVSLLRLPRSNQAENRRVHKVTQRLQHETVSGYPLRKSVVRRGVCVVLSRRLRIHSTTMVPVPGSSGDAGFHRESHEDDGTTVKNKEGTDRPLEAGSPVVVKEERSDAQQNLGRNSTFEVKVEYEEKKPLPPHYVFVREDNMGYNSYYSPRDSSFTAIKTEKQESPKKSPRLFVKSQRCRRILRKRV